MQNNILKYVEERLQQWAEWYSRGNLYGLGYPSCSIEYRLMREGIILKTANIKKTLPSNQTADEIENLVKEMATQNRIMALVLRCHYFAQGSFRVKTNRLKQLEVQISHTHFKYYVDLAHQWLAGRLSDSTRKKHE